MAERKTFVIENAELFRLNFRGEESEYNEKGKRNFNVFIPTEEMAEAMLAEGWKVFRTKPTDEDENGRPAIAVKVRFDPIPPQIVVKTSKARTFYTEEMVDTLDYARMAQVDIVANAYNWTNKRGEKGTSAYLKTMRILLEEDVLQQKYADDFAPLISMETVPEVDAEFEQF